MAPLRSVMRELAGDPAIPSGRLEVSSARLIAVLRVL
jgi:hypothetical protein